ncbi:hypothetical protein I552_8904 [Mycobacterium xenopi 3993]|nr:hypothetical protein I552_8904 [Mycobacterium xenopi 3993]
MFERVIAAVDDLVPGAEVLRPGLVVLSVRGRLAISAPSSRWPSG